MSERRELSDKLFGLFRGKVLKHLENGILKVYIPDVYPEEWAAQPDKLPDAEMVVPIFGGSNNGNGVFSYPNIGTIVVCQFLDGDQNLPVVVGATQGGNLAAMKWHEVANELDPSTGQKPSCIHMVSVGRSKIKVFEGGTIEMRVDGKPQEGEEAGKSAKVAIDQNGNVFVECDGTFQVRADNIVLNAKKALQGTSGKNVLLNAKSTVSLAGTDIISFCNKGTFSISSKHRVSEF